MERKFYFFEENDDDKTADINKALEQVDMNWNNNLNVLHARLFVNVWGCLLVCALLICFIYSVNYLNCAIKYLNPHFAIILELDPLSLKFRHLDGRLEGPPCTWRLRGGLMEM
jgi:hypothetical protein